MDIALFSELLIFAFLMMSDPQTAPRSAHGRLIYGSATAVVAASLLFFQPTEFGIKLAILSSLTLTCALAPLLDAVSRRGAGEPQAGESRLAIWRRIPKGPVRRVLRPVIVAAVIIAVAAPLDTVALASNKQVILIERGLTGSHNPQ